MSSEKTCAESAPEQFVLKGGEIRSLFPPVKDLVFKRDRSVKGLVYTADVSDWFRNGTPRGVKAMKDK